MVLLNQISNELDKESDEFKLIQNKLPKDYINTIGPNDSNNQNQMIKVLVLNINDSGFECPGMMSEEKVMKEYENSSLEEKRRKRERRLFSHHHNNSNSISSNSKLS